MRQSFQNTKAFFRLHIFLAALLIFLLVRYSSTVQIPILAVHDWFPVSQKSNLRPETYGNKNINFGIQKMRKVGIYEYCRATSASKPSANSSIELLHNSRFNLSSVTIPKIGSTSISQMFCVLNYGPAYAKENFNIPRNEVKNKLKGQSKRFFFNNTLEQTVIIVPVRNPYSRLYAAFVDKVFLPNSLSLVSDIIAYKKKPIPGKLSKRVVTDRSNSSGLSVTFQDFLNYALDPHQKRKILFGHYDPCFPRLKYLICNSNHYIVVKQETFETDITYILRSVDVHKTEHETYNIILKSLYESRVEDYIPGIIKVTFIHSKSHAKLWTAPIVAERLWKSFQIQGYISKHLPFPKQYFKSESTNLNVSLISDVFLREMKIGKLSRAESIEQRKTAMLNAYKGLSKNVIERIQKMYYGDFKAFGYNVTLT